MYFYIRFLFIMNKYSQKLNQIIEAATPLLRSIPIAEMNEKTSPDKWSKKEILGHLIDSAYNNHQRVVRAKSQGNLIFQGYDQNEWVNRNNYQNRQVDDIINTWIFTNRHLSFAIGNLPTQLLNRPTDKHNFHQISMQRLQEGSVSSLAYLVWDYNFHLEHHLGQIIDNYDRINSDFIDN